MDDHGYTRGLMTAVAEQTDYSQLRPAGAT
jgi:hypothetical protein